MARVPVAQAPVARCRAAVRDRFSLPADAVLLVGIERFDYTKGILDRLRALDDLLTREPSWKGRLVFIQAAAPTRNRLEKYSELQQEGVRLAAEINERHGDGDYRPVELIVRHHSPDEVYELFRAADACIVSSLHDGMNLVAKEFVASRDDEQGVLILSSFAGASRELSEALIRQSLRHLGDGRGARTGVADAEPGAARPHAPDARADPRAQRLSLGGADAHGRLPLA